MVATLMMDNGADIRLSVISDKTSNSVRQGSLFSKDLNLILGMNFVAGLHDFWFNGDDPVLTFTLIKNVGVFAPATVTKYGALVGNLTRGNDALLRVYYEMEQRNEN